MTSEPPLKWGKAFQRVVAEMPPSDRAEFIQHMERKAKAEADLATLRAIREYKALAASSPTTSPPTSTKEPPED